MRNFLLERTLLLLGDKSRFIFAKKLANLPKDCENFPLLLEHGEPPAQIQRRDELFCLSSFKTPPGIKIMLPKADDDTWQEVYKNFSRLVIFEGFPLGKDSTQQLIEAWRNLPKNRPPLSLALMDLNHRQGSTDLDRLADALIEAEKNYKSQGLDVIIFRNDADALNILHRRESLIQRHKKVLSRELAEIYNRKKYELDFLYEDFLMDCEDAGGCLDLAAMNKICSFESVKTSGKNSFWEAYNSAALKKLFPADDTKGTLNDLAEICGYILAGDSMPSQKVAQTKSELIRILKKNFLSRMDSGKFSGHVYAHEAQDIIAYKKLTGDKSGRFYGINAEYGRQLRQFVEKDAKEILQLALYNYTSFFERVVR